MKIDILGSFDVLNMMVIPNLFFLTTILDHAVLMMACYYALVAKRMIHATGSLYYVDEIWRNFD